MVFAHSLFKSLVIISSSLSGLQTSHALNVPLPQNAVTAGNVVSGNFLGISIELSFLDKYCKSHLSSEFKPSQDIDELEKSVPMRPIPRNRSSITSRLTRGCSRQFPSDYA